MKLNTWIYGIIEKLRKSVFYQNIAITTAGNTTAKLIALFTTPIITRIYIPEDYGVFSTLLAISGIAGSLSTLRYAITIPLAKEEELSNNLLRLSFLITIGLAILWASIILLIGNTITGKFSIEKIAPYLWVLPVLFLGQGWYEALSNWAVREKAFKLISTTKISQDTSAASLKIGLGLLGIKPLGLFVGHLALEYVGIGSFLKRLLKKHPDFFNYFSLQELKEAALRFKNFPLYQTGSQLLMSLGAQLPVILMGSLYGTKVVGIFGLAQGVINMPMTLIGQSVSQVYYSEISRFGKENPYKIYKLTKSLIKKMFWIAIIPMGFVAAFGPWIFKIVFGSNWIEAGHYVRIISLVIVFRFISSPVMSCLNVLEKQQLQFGINVFRVLLTILIFLFAYILKCEPGMTLLIFTLTLSLFYFVILKMVFKVLKNI